MSSKTYKYILDFKANTGAFRSETGRVNKEVGGLEKTFKSAAVAAAALFSVDKIISFGKQAMAAYDVQAKAERSLLVALKGRTDVQQRLIKQAQELQGKTLFGDEETIKAQALIAAFVKEEDQIKKIIPLVQDLATAKGMDLASAADLVSKTLGSSTNAMARYGIEVEGAVGSNERLESLVNSLTDAFGGQAEEAARVGTGALTQLQNKWGDIKEEIGKTIVESDQFTESISKLNEEIERLPGLIDKTAKALNFMSKAGNVVTGKFMIDFTIGLFRGKNAAEEFTSSLVTVNDQFGVMFDFGKKTTKTLADIAAENKKANEAAAKQVTTYGDLIAKIAEKNDLLKKADITDTAYIRTIYTQIAALEQQKKAFEALAVVKTITPRVEDMDKLGTIADAQLAGGGVDIPVKLNLEEMQSQMPLFQANMESMGTYMEEMQERHEAVKGALTQGFTEIGQSVVNSLGLAESGFEGFLGKMIETATQLIAIYLAQSIAGSVSNATQSAAATGPAAIITQPAFLATLIAGVLGAFAAIPKFASGGIAYGPTVGMIGEYPGASSNPEVIAPLDKLKGMLAGSGGGRDRFFIPTTRIRKGDIYISYKEAEKEFGMRT